MTRFEVHHIFYGQDAVPTDYQARVLGSDRVKAIRCEGLDQELAQTAIVVALSQAYAPQLAWRPVYVFCPDEATIKLFHEQLGLMATQLTTRLRAESANQALKTKVLSTLKCWIEQLRCGSGTWPATEPPHWASYGYPEGAKVPAWVKRAS